MRGVGSPILLGKILSLMKGLIWPRSTLRKWRSWDLNPENFGSIPRADLANTGKPVLWKQAGTNVVKPSSWPQVTQLCSSLLVLGQFFLPIATPCPRNQVSLVVPHDQTKPTFRFLFVHSCVSAFSRGCGFTGRTKRPTSLGHAGPLQALVSHRLRKLAQCFSN